MTHLHISVPAITRDTLARPHELTSKAKIRRARLGKGGGGGEKNVSPQPTRVFRISFSPTLSPLSRSLEQATVALAFRPAVRAPCKACSQATIAQNCFVLRLMGMCRLMGSHFHDWIDYNVARVADALNLLYRIGMSQTVLTHRLFLLKL